MRIRVVVKGKSNVLKAHNPNRYKTPIEQTVEKHTRLQANQASNRAPILHGPLSESIPASVKMIVGARIIGTYGSPLIYAAVQEFTHKTKKGFMRKTAFEGEQPFVEDINKTVQRVAKGH
ncbi:hypothetical protein PDQ36_23800 [Bacillus cereus]|uniref:hypothetical protein n=2 Tax=Bacillus thuringiensis TaxID=1428 RepID=UPI002A16930F|nr:hypothetical protein [Bacillus thuringiensis]MDA2355536.1 hypothetical protein [Bacillus cereus]MDA2379178.1 hypothetical protein [Bacillus cereus]MDA2626269.1 hypothetical protein [Bacillus cereus]MEC2470355.1 hypothetical protein [Bacillus thuringiensis]MEC3222327.1 hypothetical protein [Bacillus thuringiensis]